MHLRNPHGARREIFINISRVCGSPRSNLRALSDMCDSVAIHTYVVILNYLQSHSGLVLYSERAIQMFLDCVWMCVFFFVSSISYANGFTYWFFIREQVNVRRQLPRETIQCDRKVERWCRRICAYIGLLKLYPGKERERERGTLKFRTKLMKAPKVCCRRWQHNLFFTTAQMKKIFFHFFFFLLLIRLCLVGIPYTGREKRLQVFLLTSFWGCISKRWYENLHWKRGRTVRFKTRSYSWKVTWRRMRQQTKLLNWIALSIIIANSVWRSGLRLCPFYIITYT